MQGIVLAGFNEEDSKKTTGWMQEMEADFKVSHVVDDMMAEPLGEALYNPDSQVLRILFSVVAANSSTCWTPPLVLFRLLAL